MSNKTRKILSAVGVVNSITLLGISAILAENMVLNFALSNALIIFSAFMVIITIFYATKVDYETGSYECKKCGYVALTTNT